MDCPKCAREMKELALESHLGTAVAIDVCTPCQAFWFDKYESLKLSAGSTLELMKLIGEHSTKEQLPESGILRCPRCWDPLRYTNDLQGSTHFTYFRCVSEHGRFIRFFDFLKEKKFIRALTPQEIVQLRKSLQTVNCSNCGAPVSLTAGAVCAHCGSPLSILDMKQPERMLEQLRRAAEPQPVDPHLSLKLAMAKREVEHIFGPAPDDQWWSDVSAIGLVQAGLNSIVRRLKKNDPL